MSIVTSGRASKNRGPFILLFVIYALPLMAASLFYYSSDKLDLPGKNSGVFLSSYLHYKDLDIVVQTDMADNQLLRNEQWTLIYLYPGRCKEFCQQDLLELEQIRQALGKDYSRTRLLVLSSENEKDEQRQTDAIKQIPVSSATISVPKMNRLLALAGISASSPEPQTFLADNRGNLVMYYPRPINQQSIYDDLRWLLKANRS